MSSQFTRHNGNPKRFSIDDAFEEETDEAIKVYGVTRPSTPSDKVGHGDSINVNIENGRGYKAVTDISRDSDSLIQDYYDCSSEENLQKSCFRHPKVRENWRMVLAATTLLIIGTGLLVTGTLTLSEPNSALQASVFLLAGFICFIPGAYHVVYIYLAAKDLIIITLCMPYSILGIYFYMYKQFSEKDLNFLLRQEMVSKAEALINEPQR